MNYWEERQARAMLGRMDSAEAVAKDIANIYARASEDIRERTRRIFATYQTKWNLSDEDAVKILRRMRGSADIRMLRKALGHITDEKKRDEIMRELEAPAYQARLFRLEELQKQIDNVMDRVYKQDLAKQRKHYRSLARDVYYCSIYDIQHESGLGFSFAHIDSKAIDTILKSNWSGENYSKRLWNNVNEVGSAVKEELMLEYLTGKKLSECSANIQDRFQVGAFQSRRLIRTESSYISGRMQLQAYKECGAERYEYVATLDNRTCPHTCGSLDGKTFMVKDAKPGVNMNPMHPFCRCTTAIALDKETKDGLERRARDPETGKLKKVPRNMTYEEWREHYAKQPEEKRRQPAEHTLDQENHLQHHTRANKWESEAEKFHLKANQSNDPMLRMAYERRKEQMRDIGNNKNLQRTFRNARYKDGAPAKRFADITDRWFKDATPKSHPVVKLQQYIKDGQVFTVDNLHVVMKPSPNEIRIANLLRDKVGGEIFIVPKVNYPDGVGTPDYLLNGIGYDLKTISGAGKSTLRDAVKRKKKQSARFIFDLSESSLTDSEVENQMHGMFGSPQTDFVREVVIIRGDEIVKVYKRA